MKKLFRERVPFRRIVLAACLLVVWIVMAFPVLGERYARHVYPLLNGVLIRLTAPFPFSVGDCFIYGSMVGLLFYLVYILVRRRPFLPALGRMVEYLAWVYVWFYLAWGLNYFRQDFFNRTGIAYVAYSPENFRSFLTDYTDSLNAAYIPVETIDTASVVLEVKAGYRALDPRFGLLSPREVLRVKPMLISSLMSSVGVLGYMGPFLNEFNLNRELLPVQYPSTYAHEMAHILGIAGEAEANLYSYLVCTGSYDPQIRFAGYFSLLTYVLNNAYLLLSEEDFGVWMESISPEVKELYNRKAHYWQSRYSPFVGELQNILYNSFLKGNNIPTGMENYSEVIALLIAYRESKT